jgi:uncharacterized protein
VVEPLFQVKVTCVYCETTFQSSRVRPSFKKAAKTDTDFCIHYKDINPDYYVVRVCPNCGYTSTENSSDKLTAAQRQAFKEKVADQWKLRDFGGERSWDDAMFTYKLSLLVAQIKNEKSRVMAGLLHHIAWLYRFKGDQEQEMRFLQYARDEYTRTFETEGEGMNNARLMYLMGELSRRIKDYKQAIRWFGRVINDKRIMDAAMIRACREQWQVARENMEEDKIVLDEDELKELQS